MNDVSEHVKSKLLLDREAFRAENIECLRALTVADRVLCRSLDQIGAQVDEFIKTFHDQVAPVLKTLAGKRSNQTIRTSLTRNFGFQGLDVDVALDYLLELRRSQVIANLITEVGGQPHEDELRDLLNRPVNELLDLFERYQRYTQALEISGKYGLALVDPQVSRRKQRRMCRAVRKDRRQAVAHEKQRLNQIECELADLLAGHRLLLDIVDKNWSFVEILALHQQYQKILSKRQAKDKPLTAAAKLDIFETVTADFRRHNIEILTASRDNLSLKQSQALGKSVDNLLLEVFDMDNTGRNRLMVELKTYSALINEREQLLIARRHREEFLGTVK